MSRAEKFYEEPRICVRGGFVDKICVEIFVIFKRVKDIFKNLGLGAEGVFVCSYVIVKVFESICEFL